MHDFTKNGTDIINHKMGFYSVKMTTDRWTIVSLAYLLNTVHVNACSVYAINNGLDPKKQNSFDFGLQLAKSLVIPQIIRRQRNEFTSVILRKISPFMQEKEIIRNSEIFQYLIAMKGRKRCRLFQREVQKLKKYKLKNLTTQCQRCGETVSNGHSIQTCLHCEKCDLLKEPWSFFCYTEVSIFIIFFK